MKPTRILAVVAGVLALAAGCGDDDPAAGAVRTVEVEMVDIAFEPESLEVARGETVRFVFTNTGEAVHEAYVGDAAAQAQHEKDMREAKDDDDGHGHGHGGEADGTVTVEPGETGELTHTFDEAGTVEIGCHEPGHYDAGMKMRIDVS